MTRLALKEVVEGNNSLLLKLDEYFILYEKLSNTIHSGKLEEISKIFELAESVNYRPTFEGETLKRRRGEKLESLLLNVTEACDLGCDYCIYSGSYEGERLNNGAKMSFETARKAVDFFVPQAEEPAPIGFYGGEPLMNFGLIKEVVDYAKRSFPEKTFVFSMTSNFFNVEKYLDDILREQIHVQVSLDGPKEVHDKHRLTRSGKHTFARVMNNLEMLRRLSNNDMRLLIGLNGTCYDPQDFKTIVDYFMAVNEDFASMRVGAAETKGATRVVKGFVSRTAILDCAAIYLSEVLSAREPPKVLKTLFDQPINGLYMRSKKKMPEALMLNGACYPGNKKLFVDTNGEIYPCEKFGRRVKIGDIWDGVDHGQAYGAINDFTEIRNGLCLKDCWAQRLCTPCIYSAKDPKKELSVAGLAQTCDMFKGHLIVAIAMYATALKQNNAALGNYCRSLTS